MSGPIWKKNLNKYRGDRAKDKRKAEKEITHHMTDSEMEEILMGTKLIKNTLPKRKQTEIERVEEVYFPELNEHPTGDYLLDENEEFLYEEGHMFGMHEINPNELRKYE